MSQKQYSVLTFVFGNYERLRDPLEVSPHCEYVAVTDNPSLTSNIWNIKYLPSEFDGADGFTKSFFVRYHPYQFVSTNICVVMDGSVLIKRSLDYLVYKFVQSKCECSFMIHWNQINAIDEYEYWTKMRGYSSTQVQKCLAFMDAIGYNKSYKGCFETGFKICSKTANVLKLHEFVYNCLVKLGKDKNHIERVDQSIFSAIINTKFTNLHIFPVTHQIIQNDWLQYCKHNSVHEETYNINWDNMYLFNHPVEVFLL